MLRLVGLFLIVIRFIFPVNSFDGICPASSDLAYITGYSQCLRTKLADIKRQAEMLEAEGLAYEAKVEAIFSRGTRVLKAAGLGVLFP